MRIATSIAPSIVACIAVCVAVSTATRKPLRTTDPRHSKTSITPLLLISSYSAQAAGLSPVSSLAQLTSPRARLRQSTRTSSRQQLSFLLLLYPPPFTIRITCNTSFRRNHTVSYRASGTSIEKLEDRKKRARIVQANGNEEPPLNKTEKKRRPPRNASPVIVTTLLWTA